MPPSSQPKWAPGFRDSACNRWSICRRRWCTGSARIWKSLNRIEGPDLFISREGLGLERAVALLDEDLHLALGSVDFFLASRGESHTLFEELDRVFEAQVSLFELINDGLELLERFFEGWHSEVPRLLYGARVGNGEHWGGSADPPGRVGSSEAWYPGFHPGLFSILPPGERKGTRRLSFPTHTAKARHGWGTQVQRLNQLCVPGPQKRDLHPPNENLFEGTPDLGHPELPRLPAR